MGLYYDHYLFSSEHTGPAENHLAGVLTITNTGEIGQAEWMVNCNEYFPQIVPPDGASVSLDLEQEPSSPLVFSHDLWWAVCRGHPRKYTGAPEPSVTVEAGYSTTLNPEKNRPLRIEVLHPEQFHVARNLAQVRVTGRLASKSDEVAWVYCSNSVPTVRWADDLIIELAVADSEGEKQSTLVAASEAVRGGPGFWDRGIRWIDR